jgi:hypothetical protein
MHRSRHLLRLAIVLAAIGLASCGDDSNSTSPPDNVVGTWTLRSVDDVPVDAAMPADAEIFFRLSETLTLSAAGTSEDIIHNDQIDPQTGDILDSVTDTLRGNWTFDGTTLHITHDDVDELGGFIGSSLMVGNFAFTR